MTAAQFRENPAFVAALAEILGGVTGTAALDALRSEHPLERIAKGPADKSAILLGDEARASYILGEIAGYEKALRTLQLLAEGREGRAEPQSLRGGKTRPVR